MQDFLREVMTKDYAGGRFGGGESHNCGGCVYLYISEVLIVSYANVVRGATGGVYIVGAKIDDLVVLDCVRE